MILLWQILYSFYNYAEMIKREPGFFGTRAWSHYGSIYLRHFNELDHEYVTRLSRGYKGEEKQLDQLTRDYCLCYGWGDHRRDLHLLKLEIIAVTRLN